MKEKLRKVLDSFGHTQNDLAELLGITYQSVSIKINGKKDFTQSEMQKIASMYKLTPEQVYEIFISDDEQE